MERTYELEIPLKLPSGNVTERWKWYKKAAFKKQVAGMITDAIWDHPGPFPRLEKGKLTLVRRGKKFLDKDNLYTGSKRIIDVIVSLGAFPDDAPDVLELQCLQEKADDYSTKIIISWTEEDSKETLNGLPA